MTILTSSPLASGEANVAYDANLTANGGLGPYAWSVTSGTLPPGLNLNSAGSLSGTPTAQGTYSFSVSVTDLQRSPNTTSANLFVTIAPALQITTTSLSNSTVGVFYSTTLAATGGLPPYTWSITQGSLPSGLTLNATSGLISGAPTGARSSTFTVRVSDNGTPSASASASLSIAITPPPPRSAALYVGQGTGSLSGPWVDPGPPWDQTRLQIQTDGSLTLLPSSPESAINGSNFAASPTLPLIFVVSTTTGKLESLLVNPDYSLASYSSSSLALTPNGTYRLSIDPTGSNLYVTGPIDSSGTTGVTIFPGDGSLQALGTVAITNAGVYSTPVLFTPDGKLAFIPTCYSSFQAPVYSGSIISYSRTSDGTLTAAATYTLPHSCSLSMAVSSDGKYLAAGEDWSDVQVYSIASNGTLTPGLQQPFTVTLGQPDEVASVEDMVWDQSGSYLIVGVTGSPGPYYGGVAVLGFSGNALTQSADPTGGGTNRILRTGPRIYAMRVCYPGCNVGVGPYGILGFDFQNEQLIPLPGSPYPYGNSSDMVIY